MKRVELSAGQKNQETRTCEKHGDFEVQALVLFTGRLIQLDTCPECAKERGESVMEEAKIQQRKEELARWQKRLGKAGVPERFHDRRLSSYQPTTPEQKDALAFAELYAKDLINEEACGRCAVFVGRPGTGKTHLAIGIGLELMSVGKSVYFSTVFRVMRRVKETWGKNSEETETGVMNLLVFPDLLILDEVGVQFGSETEKLLLFDILNERYEKRKPTILLSNLSLPDIQKYLGERILDRMREDGGEVIPFMWESYRAQCPK